jgi:hypothetical protein
MTEPDSQKWRHKHSDSWHSQVQDGLAPVEPVDVGEAADDEDT